MSNAYVSPWDMLNNFGYHVYAQKCVFVIMSYVTFCMSHVTYHIKHATCYMSNAYVDPWDMVNNFCFHVYAQKWVFVIMSHVTCRMSYVTCLMLMLILGFLRTCTVVLWFYNGPLVSKEHSSAPLISKEHCSAPLISKEHYSAPLADNSAPLLKGALLKWANSALQKSNDG